jgi:hypothetical protein
MKIRKVLVVMVALIVAAIAGARLLPTSTATRVAISVFHVLDGAQLDDELGALSLRVAALLFSPNATVPQTRVFETALDDARRPNDLLIFNMSWYLAHRLPPADAKRLFVRRVAALQSEECDRMYLVAALLPLAERGGLARSHVHDVIDGYAAVGRSMKPGERDDERCRIYRAALDKLLANASLTDTSRANLTDASLR